MSQENVEIVRRIWEAAERRDDEAVFALHHTEIVWESHYVGPIEGSGVHHGHAGVRQFFRDWLESFGNYEADAETFIEVGDKVVVGYRVSGRGRGSGVEVDMIRWNVYELTNGLVTRVEVFDAKAEALEAAGLSAQDAHADS
jgi:ketosteroid isomerase-like protein